MKYILLLTALLSSGAFASDFDETMKLAQEGDAASQLNLGAFYESGDGVEQDFDKAFSWYAKAAIQGDSVAAWKLGDFHSKGLERAINAHGIVSVAQSVIRERGLGNLISLDPISVTLTGLTTAAVLSEQALCSSSDPDHYVDAYKWYQIANIYNPEKERLPDSKEIADSFSDYTGRNETLQVMQILSILPYQLKGQTGRSEEQVARYFRNKFKALTSVLSDKQKDKAEELAALCVNSDYQDCAIGDYNATNNQPHSFQTTLYDKSTKWKVSVCTQDEKLKGKYLSADSGYIDQIFSNKGDLLNETVLKDNEWKRQSFDKNGLLSEQTIATKLTDDDRSILSEETQVAIGLIPLVKLISRSKYDKSGRLKYKVNYWSEHSVKETRQGRNYTQQYKSSQEFYSKGGQLTRKMFYEKKGNKPLYTNYYKADGTLKRSKNADGSRRSIKKRK
jgi:hypothetical protein